ncbi:HlyD family secretion protein, partial [Psychrobacter sp. 16-Bac2893]
MNEDEPNRVDDASTPNKTAKTVENAQASESLSNQAVVDTPSQSHMASNNDTNTNIAAIQPEPTMPATRIQTDPSDDLPTNTNEHINAADTNKID